MPSPLRLCLSATFLGAITAFLLGHLRPTSALIAPNGQPASRFGSSKFSSAALGAKISRGWIGVSKLSDQGLPALTATTLITAPALKLREPVILVHGIGAGTSLATGTPVALVSDHGRYLRVRYDKQELTIPRSALQASASHWN